MALLERLLVLAQGTVRLLTLAADSPCAPDLCACAAAHGVKVLLGHQAGPTTSQLDACAAAGAVGFTHLGNGMPYTGDRHGNALVTALGYSSPSPSSSSSSPGLKYATIICNGVHLPRHVITAIRRSGMR